MKRVSLVDTARGISVALMIAYHFSFDLNYFGVIHQDMNHARFWLAFRAFIVCLFLILAGISLALASGLEARHFWRRQGRLLAAASAVTIGSWLMFPKSYIYFGILHFIFVASLIGRLFQNHPKTALASGLCALALGLFYSNPVFDLPYLNWIGFMTHKPYTEDYVPVFPWIGMILIGIFLGKLLFERIKPAWMYLEIPAMKFPALAGRHSLAIYLLHQPILIGILYFFVTH